jgi:hypothetical protein
MGFTLKDVATTASNFVNKTLDNISPANAISGALSGAQNAVTGLLGQAGIPGANGLLKPIPGRIVPTEIDQNKFIDINGELTAGKELVQIERKPGEPFPNELNQFDSYNCIFTLSVLSANSINFPNETYRKGIYGPIIMKSGGTGDIKNANAVQLTNFKSRANESGRFDCFMDNVKISGIMGFNQATGTTNSTAISFTVTEPYSVGLFFQELSTVALTTGWKNWLSMPLLLTLEFKGHLTANQQNFTAPLAKKNIPLKLREINMRINGQGSVYQVEAYPWNEKAFSTSNNTLLTDAAIEGGTVQEMLQSGSEENKQSLQSVINDKLAELAKEKKSDPDKVLIYFPIDLQTGKNQPATTDNANPPGATVEPSAVGSTKNSNKVLFSNLGVELENDNLLQKSFINPIGASPIGFQNDEKRAEALFGKEENVYDEKTGTYVRGNLAISKTKGIAKFKQGGSITDAIEEIIIASSYGRRALDPANIDKDNKVNWFRVESQYYILSSDKEIKGEQRFPTLTVFRVIPYKVDYTHFVAKPAEAKKITEKKRNAIKKYEYLYTGKNLDIIDFNIDFKASFYMPINADLGKNNEFVQENLQEKTAPENGMPNASNTNILVVDEQAIFRPEVRSDQTSMGSSKGGITAGEDASTIAARQFSKVLNSQADMVQLSLKILGDPYYIADSGMGNYSAKSTNIPEMNSDGAINAQDGEVFVVVNFRNPIDLDPNRGLYDFGSQAKVVPGFSGLYRVLQVESTIERNVFTQQLKLVRMMNQDGKESGTKSAESPFTPPKTANDAMAQGA